MAIKALSAIHDYFTGGEEGRANEEELNQIELKLDELKIQPPCAIENLLRNKADILESKVAPHRIRQLIAASIIAVSVIIGGAVHSCKNETASNKSTPPVGTLK